MEVARRAAAPYNPRPMRFSVFARDPGSGARVGRIDTSHGSFDTPAFMPVGTKAAVKTMPPDALRAAGVEILLCNTYHLALRPGEETIAKLGGLQKFMGWHGPILTDSGGYQVFSLAHLRRVTDEGVEFRSHLDGSTAFFTPERVVEIQTKLGSDILMPLDEPSPHPCERREAERAAGRTHAWWKRSPQPQDGRALFGIVQGSTFPDLRRRCAEQIASTDPPGFSIGGLSMGEPASLLYEIVEGTAAALPADRPRYLMGAGTPADIVRAVLAGVDMFDCILPTRLGRNGWAFTSGGMLKVRNRRFEFDEAPLDPKCGCPCCRQFTRAYLRHCFHVEEILGLAMLSLHNLYYYSALMSRVREAIPRGGLREILREVESTGPPLRGRR
ncbi:MAG: tRNA guanosine(34) transglycosylase Tgt [Planctomycetes bacterium]|nr:tRNA guanosine(34) transglycosylase Tgt [Planctomycetota bacterium]